MLKYSLDPEKEVNGDSGDKIPAAQREAFVNLLSKFIR